MICVISKNTYGKNAVHDIQTNNTWCKNPYDDYAVVPDYMVQNILKTKGYCDITLDRSGSEVISFIAREIPEEEPIVVEPMSKSITAEDILNALTGGAE